MKKLFILVLIGCHINALWSQILALKCLGGPIMHINNPVGISHGGSYFNTSLNYQASASIHFEYKKFGVEFGYLKRRQNLQFAPLKAILPANSNKKAGEISIPYFVTAYPLIFSFNNVLNEKTTFKALIGSYLGLEVTHRIIGETTGVEFFKSGPFTSNLDGFENEALYYEFTPTARRQVFEGNIFSPSILLGFELQYKIKERYHLLMRTTGTWSTFPLLAGELEAGPGNAQRYERWVKYFATDFGQNLTFDLGLQYQITRPKKIRKTDSKKN